ncbi:MAG TPA: extradiol ring-cleavage dioxygenase [Lachnospiraceae bacterium]|nr:extradiol ring-cleavage dioxygenase [Lachnospiraceae bacterium]
MAIEAAFMVPHPPMIVPDVGRGSEERVRATIDSYEKVADEIAHIAPDTIIISSPHSIMYGDYFHISPGRAARGSFSSFGAKNVSFNEQYDDELVSTIAGLCDKADIPAGTLGEREPELDHGTMVPLYFIEKKYTRFKLVRIGLSGLSLTEHYRLGQMVAEAVGKLGRKAVYVASGDLSHKLQDYGPYGFAKEGPVYDKRIMDVCSRAAFGELFDFDESFCDKAAECGHRSFVIMAGALDGVKVRATQLSHEDVTGVGYGICTFYPEEYDKDDRRFLDIYLKGKHKEMEERYKDSDEYVLLALRSLQNYIINGRVIDKNDCQDLITDEMNDTKAGAFVSIHEHGKLRGCIGTILPTTGSVADEIIQNAVSACARDPRFEPIREDEIPYLEVNVDVLTKPEKISSKDELDVKRYGVIVTHGYKRGLLLPDLDGVDTIDDQIDIARRKGGIREDEPYELERFEVVRHI